MKRSMISILLAAALAAGSAPALAALRPGTIFPNLEGRDVTGRPVQLHSLIRGRRTLLVAITDRHAKESMRVWFNDADRQAPPGTNRVSIASIEVPFFVSDDFVRAEARKDIPQRYWRASLLDTDRDLASALGLEIDRLPTVFVLDARGRVLAWVHGAARAPGSEAIWNALSR